MQEFDDISPYIIQGCINRSVFKLYDLYKEMKVIIDNDEDEDEKLGIDTETADLELDTKLLQDFDRITYQLENTDINANYVMQMA